MDAGGPQVAVVGMSCRLPRAPDLNAFWQLLAAGRHAIAETPAERLATAEGCSPQLTEAESGLRFGAFLDRVDGFDPAFFDISPREAAAMDPQQRLVLELAWEALEDARIVAGEIRGDRAGVFLGSISSDYANLTLRSGSEAIGRHTMTGLHRGIIANRVSFALGLNGPSMTVDAAQSSSLVAVHLACEALLRGDATLALAGGVHLNLDPSVALGAGRFGGLSPDGRCFTFDSRANGYVRGEGGGVVALKTLVDAEADGDHVYCVIRGGAVNNDGASEHLTVPSRTAQQSAVREACSRAGLERSSVQYVELHGTGTAVGDPIEAAALGAALGAERSKRDPLVVGSAKTNVGHLEGAAGIVGLIKAALAIERREIPASLNFSEPNPQIPLEALRLRVQDAHGAWPHDDRPLVAGVSSFGMGGTNCHLVLAQAPDPKPQAQAEQPNPPLPDSFALPLSAKSEAALQEAAANLATHLTDNPELDPADVGFSLATTRALFEQRAVALGSDRAELLAALASLAAGTPAPNSPQGKAQSGRLAYLFTGQGAQRPGMGKELYEASPVFAAALDEVRKAFAPHLGRSLRKIVFAETKKAKARLQRTEFTQPALFAIEVALFRLLESIGLKPDYLAGHSIGELSAAYLSGVLSLPDAAKLIAARGALMGELPEGGAMVAIEATELEVAAALLGKEQELSIAAINGPSAVVISGQEQAVLQVQADFEAKERRTKRLSVSHAFHSPLIEPMLEEFEAVAKSLDYQEPKIPIVSTLTGEALSKEQATDPAYWVAQVRGAVRFGDAIATLESQGTSTYLELGPDGVLTAMAASCLPEDSQSTLIATLREGRAEQEAIALSLAKAHVAGAKLDLSRLYPGAKRVSLPTYPFQRERYWLAAGSAPADASAIGQRVLDHPLLAAAIEDPDGERLILTGRISLATHPWLADHTILGTAILPGTAFVELALQAGEQVGAETISELTLQAPLIFVEGAAVSLRVTVAAPDESQMREISIHSRSEVQDGEGEWTLHATGLLSAESPGAPDLLVPWPPEGAQPLEPADLYERLAEIGFDYGPAFQGLRAAWTQGEEVYAEVSLGEEQRAEAARFAIHPALLDASFHAPLAVAAQGNPTLPFDWHRVRALSSGASSLRVRVSVKDERLEVLAADSTGVPVAEIGSLLVRPTEQGALATRRRDSLYSLGWEGLGPQADAAASLAILGEAEIEGLAGERQSDLPALLEALDEDEASQTILVDARAWAAASEPIEASHAVAARSLQVVQGLLAQESLAQARFVFLTERAFATGEEEQPSLPAATLAGLLHSAGSEHPDRFAVIDVDGTAASLAALSSALPASAEEPQLALREGELLAPRLVRAPAPAEDEKQAALFEPDRTILITGATGGLGALFARHLVSCHDARHLLLVSRSGEEAKGATELQAELEALGAKATIVACDVSDRGQLQKLFGSIDDQHPLGAVIHAAGVIDDGLIEALDPERLDRVLAPKADAAWHLHELTADLDLSAFVMFSSVIGTLGGSGQGNYAAANSFLDALASERRARGLPATSVAWGLWERESAMTAGLSKADHARMKRSGIGALTDERGLGLFEAALRSGASRAVAFTLDRATLRSQATAGTLSPVFSGLVRGAGTHRKGSSSQFAALPEAEREGVVLDAVRAEVAVVLGHASGSDVDPERAFKDLGFDSLAAMELRNRLIAATGLRLPATLVFDFPTSAKLAGRLLEEVSETGGAVRKAAVRAQASEEPIAIVGMSCRYPGDVSSPEELWELVAAGREGISEFPSDRGWDLERLYDPDLEAGGERTTSYSRHGGFLPDAAEFDADFFGVSPREALTADPQQRLLLEASWEALEDAGVDPAGLHETQTGVFAGVMYQDYGVAPDTLQSLVSGRTAYTLGLEGPAVTVDTACSSSLVAMHLAAQALRSGECDLALAGGVTVLATPNVFIGFSRQRGLAPDGRSKSFAESADGVAWGEGIGVLALERLSEAKRNGHEILAVLKGSAVNQDGASNGLTAPNGPSQERVIRQALANAGLQVSDVDAVEAHGTGTTLGDPIEAGALLATYGQDREEPLKLGSIKSNIGHTQAAAGVAGVIKMVQAMRHGVLPKTLHVDQPSTHVDWESGEIELLTEEREWQANGKVRRAGVSSFGISGTNAHVILEEAPEPTAVELSEQEQAPSPLPGTLALPLSAKSEAALQEAAANLATHLKDNPELGPADVGFSLVTTRALFDQRAVVLGSDRAELLASLQALGTASPSPNVLTGRAREGRLAYLFTGQGAQRPTMGKELYEASPTFASALDEVCAAFDPHLGRSLKELLFAAEGSAEAELLEQTTFTQPALFAIEVALFRLLESIGLKPDQLAGHSIGELAAAHLAGVWELKDAAKLVAARGALMGELPKGGAMIAIEASEEEAKAAIEGKEAELSIAAINGPSAVVISGQEQAALQVQADFEAKERRTKRLSVSHAFHSPLIEPMLEKFTEVAKSLDYQEPKIPIVSTLTGEALSKEQATDPAYWVAQVRGAVRFADAIATLDAQGSATYLELGPDGVLSAMAASCLPEDSRSALVPTLREGREDQEAIATAIAKAHISGAKADLARLYPGAKRVSLPTYPFQRERFWLSAGPTSTDASSIGQGVLDHPLLAAAIEDPDGERLTLTGRISLSSHPWLADHAVLGTVILPGTAFVELALKAGEQAGTETISELTLQAPLVLSEGASVDLQLSVSAPNEEGERPITIHSRAQSQEEAGEWTLHASGSLSAKSPAAPQPLGAWPPEGAEALETTDLYERLAEIGFDYGPAFQGLTAAWAKGEEIYAEVSLPEGQREDAGRFAIHPALLDSTVFQAIPGPDTEGGEEASKRSEPIEPSAWAGVSLLAAGAQELRVRLISKDDQLELDGFDSTGMPTLRVESLAARPLTEAQLKDATRRRSLHDLQWPEHRLEMPSDAPAPTLAILGEPIASIEATAHPDLEALLQASAEGDAPEVVLIDARTPQAGADLLASLRANTAEALSAVQAFLASEPLASTRLAFLTEKAIATTEGEAPDLATAPIWGLVRSAQSEHPGRFALIDTDGEEASLTAIGAALAQAQEHQIAIRQGKALVPRLANATAASEDEEQPARFDPDKTILITGGLSGLGALFAKHLAESHDARQLLLVSRSGDKAEGAAQLKEELQSLGAQVRIAACDVSQRDQLAELISSIDAQHPLGAVIHAAGVLDDGLIEALDPERLDRVLAPKANAAHHLHELSAGIELSAFVMFSSIAGALGGPGQANYAAANSFLDALAATRQAQGLPATSIDWGLWERESTMTAGLGKADMARMQRSGIVPIADEQGLELFDAALAHGSAQAVAFPLNRSALGAAASAGALPPVFAGLIKAGRRKAATGSLATKLADVPEAEHEAFVIDLVRGEVAAVLGHESGEAVDPERAFSDLGFDSLAAVELRNRLVAVTGISLQPTAVFDYPSPEKLAKHLLSQAAVGEGARAKLQEEEIRSTLTRLEELLQGIEQDDLLRKSTQTRLRSFMTNLSDSAAPAETEASGDELESLSNDEIFKLIDEEFGGDDLTQAGQAPGDEGA